MFLVLYRNTCYFMTLTIVSNYLNHLHFQSEGSKERDAVNTLLAFSQIRGMSPTPSVSSDSDTNSLSADSGISSSGEDNYNEIDIPVTGGIMKKLGHRQLMRTFMSKTSQDKTTTVHCTKETSLSTTTNSVIVSVRDYNSLILSLAC